MNESLTTEERADAYVLGLLDEAERDRVEAELATDVALSHAVGQARDRFLELDLAGPASGISSDLWMRIDTALANPASQISGQSAPGRWAVNDNKHSRWRSLALSAMAASALLFVGLAYTLVSQPDPQVVAILMNDRGEPVAMVEDFGNDAAKVIPLTDVSVPADRSLQVWTLPSQEMGPVSLGVLDGWNTVRLEWPELPVPQAEQLYEITIEPLGGSPTGRPTGPILGKGFAKIPRP